MSSASRLVIGSSAECSSRLTDIVAVCTCSSTGEIYNDLGGDYFRRRDPDKITRRLVTQLERLGHTVTLERVAA